MSDTTFTVPDDPGPAAPLACAITTGGVNAVRAVTLDEELPVVLRDPIADRDRFRRFACDVRKASPPTPDRVEPDVAFTLGVHNNARVTMPDGQRVDFMSFHHWVPDGEDDDFTKEVFPSPTLRVREGQVVHTTLIPSRDTHTVHHHGIEPLPHNDGVGHASFEVDNLYTYQWRASASGSYFYHCHKNTVLHFEMGMYGALIVDPAAGEGFAYRGRELVPYDHEALWIADDVDPRWHTLDHMSGLQVCDWDPSQHLLRFEPRYFLLSGVPDPQTRTDPRVAVTCQVGERVLVRLLNAAYGPMTVELPFDAECVNIDGHTLGGGYDERYSRPYTVPGGTPFELSTAQRYDLLLTPDRPGVFEVPFRFKRWIRSDEYGLAVTTITVTD